jgi:muconolactone delta-isomerase
MINITLPEYLDEDFIALIPEQRNHIDLLMSKAVVTSYSLSVDRSKLWVTMNAKNGKNVEEILHSFPIADYITYEITELFFHNSSSFLFPTMSLN